MRHSMYCLTNTCICGANLPPIRTETYDNICACGTPYNGLRGQCDDCTEAAEQTEAVVEREYGM